MSSIDTPPEIPEKYKADYKVAAAFFREYAHIKLLKPIQSENTHRIILFYYHILDQDERYWKLEMKRETNNTSLANGFFNIVKNRMKKWKLDFYIIDDEMWKLINDILDNSKDEEFLKITRYV